MVWQSSPHIRLAARSVEENREFSIENKLGFFPPGMYKKVIVVGHVVLRGREQAPPEHAWMQVVPRKGVCFSGTLAHVVKVPDWPT